MPTFKEILDAQFGGTILSNRHTKSSGEACALELLSVKKGIRFTDSPSQVRCFDFRSMNDMYISADIRTQYMLQMLEAYEDSLDWNQAKQNKVLERIVIATVNHLIANLPGLPEEVARQCKAVNTLEEAKAAAYTLRATTIVDSTYANASTSINRAANMLIRAVDVFPVSELAASYVAFSACSVSDYAASAIPRSKARAAIFIKACKIWLEAAKD